MAQCVRAHGRSGAQRVTFDCSARRADERRAPPQRPSLSERTRRNAVTGLVDAIVLVGGKGTRLRPLTLSAPKPMLPTAGVPFLTHQLARAAASGVEHVVLATSYRAEMFAEAFGDGSGLGLSIDYVCESTPLGTGGGIRNAAGLLRGDPDDPVVVLNGDILSGHDLAAQVDLHRNKDAAVTLHLVEVDDPSR